MDGSSPKHAPSSRGCVGGEVPCHEAASVLRCSIGHVPVRLAYCCLDVAVRQVERAQQRAGTANGHNLGMRGRVVVGRDLVPAFRDDCVVADDDCAEWSAAVRAHFLKRKRDRAPHKSLFPHHPTPSSNGGTVYLLMVASSMRALTRGPQSSFWEPPMPTLTDGKVPPCR